VIVLSLTPSALAGPRYKVLHYFNGTDGTGPWGGVTLDANGNLFGASASGGNLKECNGYGCGLIFTLIPSANGKWSESVLYSFAGGNDGDGPYGRPVFDPSGKLYGTTTGGGNGVYPDGTVFQLTPGLGGWSHSVLFDFDFYDGADPTAGVVMDTAGNLYGTTPSSAHGGIAFQLTPGSGGWDERPLHTFSCGKSGCPHGAGPGTGLILDASGNLFSTTSSGGAYNGGTVYELYRTSTGWKEKVLHSFHLSQTDGNTPGWGSLFMDSSGSLYGTTAGGGCCGGVIFKLTPESGGRWKETILYNFQKGATGYSPNTGVVMDKAGNLYGTTGYGGDPSCDCGVIYKLSPRPKGKWSYTVLHEFGIGNDGGLPEGNLVMDSKGNLYGGTVLGGTYGGGVVFEITP
jgi:uncharacterized repeat protein (TIGR03803 family)